MNIFNSILQFGTKLLTAWGWFNTKEKQQEKRQNDLKKEQDEYEKDAKDANYDDLTDHLG